MKRWIKENKILIIIWLIFEIVAISLFITTNKLFYLLNFTYIGSFIVIGIILMNHKKKYATKCILCCNCIKQCSK